MLHPTPRPQGGVLLPTPYTQTSRQGPTPYTLHPTPYTLHPTPYTLHPTPYTLHPTPYTLHPTPKPPYAKPEPCESWIRRGHTDQARITQIGRALRTRKTLEPLAWHWSHLSCRSFESSDVPFTRRVPLMLKVTTKPTSRPVQGHLAHQNPHPPPRTTIYKLAQKWPKGNFPPGKLTLYRWSVVQRVFFSTRIQRKRPEGHQCIFHGNSWFLNGLDGPRCSRTYWKLRRLTLDPRPEN